MEALDGSPYEATYRTAEPMAPAQSIDPRSSEIPAGWRSITGAERRKKVDSVASLNEMAERDMAEFMSESSLANNLFGYSPQSENYGNVYNDEENFPVPTDLWNRNFVELRERPPLYTNLSNVPLYLPQNLPISTAIQQSHPGFGPPAGPVASSPNYVPLNPILSRSQVGIPMLPAAIPTHHIPQNLVAIANPIFRSVQSPPNQATPGFITKSPPEESPRLRERALPSAREQVRERAQPVKSEEKIVERDIPYKSPKPTSVVPAVQPPAPPATPPSTAAPIKAPIPAAKKPDDENGESLCPKTCFESSPCKAFPIPRLVCSRRASDTRRGSAADITISFRPKISLARGEVVRLVLAEFSGLDATSFRVRSLPPEAFTSASWAGKEQALSLTVNKEMPAHERITVVIPGEVCIRKVVKEPQPRLAGEPRERSAAAPAGTASTLHSPHSAFSKNAINLELRLQMEIDEVARDIEGFKAEVVGDVARAASILPSSLQVSSLQAGSIIVHLSMAADTVDVDGRPALQVARGLTEQARDRSSRLFEGKHTCKTISLEIASLRERPRPVTQAADPPAGADGSPKQDEKRLSAEEERRARAEEKRKKFLEAAGARPAAGSNAPEGVRERAPSISTSNEPVGIDISFAVNLRPVGVFVTDVRPDGAAHQSGQLFKGDVITSIDGRALTSAMSKADVAGMLVGPPLSEVTLDVLRPNSKSGLSDAVKVTIKRLFASASTAQRKASTKAAQGYEEWELGEVTYDEIPVYDDIPIDDSTEIPDSDASYLPDAAGDGASAANASKSPDPESMTQAEWARRMLQQKGTEERKTVQGMNLDAVRQQAQWAKEQLNSVPEHTEAAKFDASSVAQQAQWAKEQLSRQEEQDKVSKFDSSSVAQQAQWAKEQLSNLPEHDSGAPKFDSALVAQQAQWAKEQLSNLPEHEKASKFDATSVAQQAQWAKEQLSNLPEREKESKFDPSAVAEQAKWAKEQIQQKGA